jgi:hypothetical protein
MAIGLTLFALSVSPYISANYNSTNLPIPLPTETPRNKIPVYLLDSPGRHGVSARNTPVSHDFEAPSDSFRLQGYQSPTGKSQYNRRIKQPAPRPSVLAR